MAVTVLLPGLLATESGGRKEFELEAATIEEALKQLPVSDLLFDERGALRPLVNVYVDGQDMRGQEGVATALTGDETIRVVAAIVGG